MAAAVMVCVRRNTEIGSGIAPTVDEAEHGERDMPSRGCRQRVASLPPKAYYGAKGAPMYPRLKRLIGSILIVILVIVYAVAATLVAETRLAQSGTLAHFTYFLFSGLLWVLPAMLIVKWMYGAPKKPS